MNCQKLELNFNNSNKCTGCAMCAEVCPVQCIKMLENDEGFIEAFYDNEKCVHCHKCFNKCPQNNEIKFHHIGYCMAGKTKDNTELMKSSSGGIFYEIGSSIIQKGGVVVGAAWVGNNRVKHIMVDKIDNLYQLQGSKYVQSDTSNIYGQVKKELQKNRYVLFSGTPCQVAALKQFLGEDYDKLYTVGLICHGVPSQRLFQKYIDWLDKRSGGNIIHYKFRNKQKYGWGLSYSYSYYYQGKERKKICLGRSDPFYRSFLDGETYRESCYACPYARPERIEDITLGDFWGIEKVLPNFPKSLGVSLIMSNEKGIILINEIIDNINYENVQLSDVIGLQVNLRRPTKRPKKRDYFKIIIKSNDGIDKLCTKKDILYKILGCLPSRLLVLIKKIRKV